MKKPENKSSNNSSKERDTIKVDSFKVMRASMIGKSNAVVADLEINGVKIYGVFVREAKNGDFLSFPQVQAANGKYYHIAYAPLSEKDEQDIIAEIENKLNNND